MIEQVAPLLSSPFGLRPRVWWFGGHGSGDGGLPFGVVSFCSSSVGEARFGGLFSVPIGVKPDLLSGVGQGFELRHLLWRFRILRGCGGVVVVGLYCSGEG